MFGNSEVVLFFKLLEFLEKLTTKGNVKYIALFYVCE